MGGETPIFYEALSCYAGDHGIVGDDFRVFRRLVRALDDEWLLHKSEMQPAAK